MRKTEMPNDLPSLLERFSDMIQRSSMDLVNPYALVLELGRSFTPQRRPKGIKRGRQKQCYENAYALLAQHPTLTYCEGFVLAEGVRIPVEHAWCIDEEGNVVDNTLRDPSIAYFGIPFDREWAQQQIVRGAGSLVDELLMAKEIPETAIATASRLPSTPS